jgi:hypothetical protein
MRDYSKMFLYSPNTDVYNMGLIISIENSKDVIIQNNVQHSLVQTYIHLTNLTLALCTNLDLATLTSSDIGSIMVALYIATGSGFTSYFKSIGKASFLNIFFQLADFFSGKSLNEFSETNKHMGFLSFLRLVGTTYFKKHYTSFFSLYQHHTPQQLYNSIDVSLFIQDRYKQWIQKIRTVVSERIVSEDQMVPSITSLWIHWLRKVYLCSLWHNSPLSHVFSGSKEQWMASKGWNIQYRLGRSSSTSYR